MTAELVFSSLGYIPLLGWMVPLYLKPDSEQAQFHGRQGLAICLFFIVIFILGWVLQNFIPVSHESLKSTLFYILSGCYTFFLLWGIVTVFFDNLRIPYFANKADEFRL